MTLKESSNIIGSLLDASRKILLFRTTLTLIFELYVIERSVEFHAFRKQPQNFSWIQRFNRYQFFYQKFHGSFRLCSR